VRLPVAGDCSQLFGGWTEVQVLDRYTRQLLPAGAGAGSATGSCSGMRNTGADANN
jgi:hypothetical protein